MYAYRCIYSMYIYVYIYIIYIYMHCLYIYIHPYLQKMMIRTHGGLEPGMLCYWENMIHQDNHGWTTKLLKITKNILDFQVPRALFLVPGYLISDQHRHATKYGYIMLHCHICTKTRYPSTHDETWKHISQKAGRQIFLMTSIDVESRGIIPIIQRDKSTCWILCWRTKAICYKASSRTKLSCGSSQCVWHHFYGRHQMHQLGLLWINLAWELLYLIFCLLYVCSWHLCFFFSINKERQTC